ncbi:MAG: GNAT family N-acetyltransferase [Alphaproteobacteria bacterium]|nr:GNAT family N-acetyltransferase [Alphaproteobacteria bacterium]
MIENFEMPSEIKGKRICLKRVEENDTNAIKKVCDAIFSEGTLKRIEKVMGYFSDGPDDIPSLVRSLNRTFEKNGFNYFIFKDDKVIGQINGFPCQGYQRSVVTIWGWISDAEMRKGYMKEAIKLLENEHFSRSLMSLEISAYNNLAVHALCHSLNFYGAGERTPYQYFYRHRSDWMSEQMPQRIIHHDDISQAHSQKQKGERS